MDPEATDGFPELVDRLCSTSRQLMYRFHSELADKFGPVSGELSYYDVYMAGVLRRSYGLTRGFFDLVESRNFSAATPLIRLQVDNALRTAASVWTRDPKEFFSLLRQGKPVNKMRSGDGKPMTDRYLCERLSLEHPWIRSLYEETSAFVHLSDKHFAAALLAGGGYENFTCMLAQPEPAVPDGAYGDAITSFIRITMVTLEQLDVYAKHKRTENGA